MAAQVTQSTVVIEPLVGGPVGEPGGTVHITVQASAGVVRVLLIGGGEAVEINTPPFEADITIPGTAAGPLSLVAVGDDGEGFAVSDPLVLNVIPGSAITSFEGSPSALSLIQGAPPSQLEADARYEDGVVRRITGLFGTEFISSDATVVTVSASGQVTPVGAGHAMVTIRNGAVSIDVPVAVLGTGEASCVRCPRVVPAR
jgi:hypothetical protein